MAKFDHGKHQPHPVHHGTNYAAAIGVSDSVRLVPQINVKVDSVEPPVLNEARLYIAWSFLTGPMPHKASVAQALD
jgi:hypothetical protein